MTRPPLPAALALLLAGCSALPLALPAPPGEGAPAEPPARITGYRLDLDLLEGPDPVLEGDEVIALAPSSAPALLDLPIEGHELLSVQSADGSVLPHGIDHGRLRVRASGEVRVRYRVRGPKGLVVGPDFVHTEFFTCHWMLCDERPGVRAPFSLSLGLPAGRGWDAVASGAEQGRSREPDGRLRVRFVEPLPYPSYLYGFAAGKLTRLEQREGERTLVHLAQGLTEGEMRQALFPAGSMLRFFEEKAGISLPHGAYAQVVVAGEAAQEMSSFSVLGREVVAAALTDPTEDWALAHELSHQFWGNALTCGDWRDFWLNEGFAVFMTALWKEHRHGRAAYDREMTLARSRWKRSADAGFDKPLSWPGEYPSLKIKRGIVYSKAACFLDELRRRLGDERFFGAIAAYTKKHAFSSVSSRDLQEAMQAVSPDDLSPLFDAWGHGEASRPPSAPHTTP